jgi:hypothetical protein
MAEEAEPGFADSVFSSITSGIQHIIEPEEKTVWHTITHDWLSLTKWTDDIGEWGISRGLFLIGLFVPLYIAASALLPGFSGLVFGWLLFGFPIIGPVVMIGAFWGAWVWYVQSLFVYKRTDPILLEVKMPAEVSKSPRAMEQVFSNMWIRMHTTTFVDRNWYGGVLPYHSFEMASFGGEVHFFIWTKRMFKNTVELNMYAQYPGVEIVEAEDYATKFVYDDSVECFVTEHALSSNLKGVAEVDPLAVDEAEINAYMPKSYVDFELDKDPKDEHKVDPFANVVEALSSIGKGEQVWVQMVIRPYFGKKWKDALEKVVQKIRIASTMLEGVSKEDEDAAGFPRPTWKQNEQIRIIERHLSKLPFQVGFRAIYSAPAGKMRGPEYTAMRWIWRPFANYNWMSILRPRRGHNIFDYAWQDWNGVRWRLFSRRFLDAYRRRCFFNYPWMTQYQIFSTEMLATLWHPPSTVVKAPGLARIAVSKGEAPSNLPI